MVSMRLLSGDCCTKHNHPHQVRPVEVIYQARIEFGKPMQLFRQNITIPYPIVKAVKLNIMKSFLPESALNGTQAINLVKSGEVIYLFCLFPNQPVKQPFINL